MRRPCIRTRANTGKHSWRTIYALVPCQGVICWIVSLNFAILAAIWWSCFWMWPLLSSNQRCCSSEGLYMAGWMDGSRKCRFLVAPILDETLENILSPYSSAKHWGRNPAGINKNYSYKQRQLQFRVYFALLLHNFWCKGATFPMICRP